VVFEGAASDLVIERRFGDDWERWSRLRLRALADAPYAYSAVLADWSGAGEQEARWRARLESVPLNLVAILAGAPVGMVSATEPDSDTVELISMWVAPEVRGQGVGDALVASVAAWARQQGARAVELDVLKNNSRAIAFYTRNGFVDIPSRQGCDPCGAEHRMRMCLDG